ncbi:hypothetical protein AMTR_s00098p00075150 [Amborella trichopoda]|uniref:Uncharacterized protein n=1 Tax=Amborella trichopoda TaxID=13333 RepID=W1NWW5_AMBTC|nr:hypothetical protein AMTR_s00098p00075150 [Amborella trichopoda]
MKQKIAELKALLKAHKKEVRIQQAYIATLEERTHPKALEIFMVLEHVNKVADDLSATTNALVEAKRTKKNP